MSNPTPLARILDAQAQASKAAAAIPALTAALTPVLASALNQAQTELATLQADLAAVAAALQPPAPLPPPPAPPPPPLTLLQRLQAWWGRDKVGVYTGIKTKTDTIAQLTAIAQQIKAWGGDFVLVKCGEGGNIWHNAAFADIRQAFFAQGVGFAPYWYCLPNGGQTQIDACVLLAKLCGGVVLDGEDEYAGQDVALQHLLNGIHAGAPDAVIVVTGYGDPITRFGPSDYSTAQPERGGWPFHTVATANVVYQPQAYIGVWDKYTQGSVAAALQWCDDQCVQAFGARVVLTPAINVQGIKSLDDFTAEGAWWKPYQASICIWEYEQVNLPIIAAVKKGIQG